MTTHTPQARASSARQQTQRTHVTCCHQWHEKYCYFPCERFPYLRAQGRHKQQRVWRRSCSLSGLYSYPPGLPATAEDCGRTANECHRRAAHEVTPVRASGTAAAPPPFLASTLCRLEGAAAVGAAVVVTRVGSAAAAVVVAQAVVPRSGDHLHRAVECVTSRAVPHRAGNERGHHR